MFTMIERKHSRKIRYRPTVLDEAECELEMIQRQKSIQDSMWELEAIFYTHSKAAMMRAKFYHECRMLNIPCVLEVKTQFGQLDALIEIKNRYFVIEFKSTRLSAESFDTKCQLERYLLHNCPVILIYDSVEFPVFLCKLKRKTIQKGIYIFEKERLKKYQY